MHLFIYLFFFTSDFKAAFFLFPVEKLLYWKIPAKVQSHGLAVSVGFWASTPAAI